MVNETLARTLWPGHDPLGQIVLDPDEAVQEAVHLVFTLFEQDTSALAVVRRHYGVVIGAGGVVLIGMGVLIWTGEFTQLNLTVDHWLTSLHVPDFNSDT